MIRIKSYSKNKENAKSTNIFAKNNTTTITNTTISSEEANKLKETHKIWGQDFNGTQDVDGDLTITNGNISVNGNATFNTTNVRNDLWVSGNTNIKNNLNVSGSTTTNSISANTSSFNTVNSTTINNKGNLSVSGTTNLYNTLNMHNKNITNVSGITATTASAQTLSATTINSTNINNSDTIVTKNLTVTGSAHFFELIIDKIKSAGGSVLFTPADGFVIDKIVEEGLTYTLYWKNNDGTNAIKNMWQVNDQALCMSFNKASVGQSTSVNNKYYWSLVTEIGKDEDDEYNYIKISKVDKDGTLNPEVGDNIVMCGYRGTDDIERQSAIYISAYDSLDSEIKAPFIAQYRGINDFSLSSHRKSYFDARNAEFIGNFKVSGDKTIEEYIDEKVDEKEITEHPPYIQDGYWYVYDSSRKKYIQSIKAQGDNGLTPYIGTNGNWWIGTTDTQIKAQGNNGLTPYIGANGNWWVGETDLGVKAQGDKGNDGENGTYLEYAYIQQSAKPSKPTFAKKTEIASPWSLTPPQISWVSYTNSTISYDGDGVYDSSESARRLQGVIGSHNDFKKDRVSFKTTHDKEKIKISIKASSEYNYDFIYIGKLDTTYSNDNEIKSNYFTRESGVQSEYKSFEIEINGIGDHYIEMIYTSDISTEQGNDCGFYKIDGFSYADNNTIWYSTNTATYDETNKIWIYNSSTWSEPQEYMPKGQNGNNGADAEFYQLDINNSQSWFEIDENKNVKLFYYLNPILYHIKGNAVSVVPRSEWSSLSFDYSAHFCDEYGHTSDDLASISFDTNTYVNPTSIEWGNIQRILDVTCLMFEIDETKTWENIGRIRIPTTFKQDVIFEIDQELLRVISQVNGYDGRISTIEQTSSAITLNVDNLRNDLLATGINIQDKKVTVTANNFTINNNYGQKVLGTDSRGNLSIGGIVNAQQIQLQSVIFANGAFSNYYKSGSSYYYKTNIFQRYDYNETMNRWDLNYYLNALPSISSRDGLITNWSRDNYPDTRYNYHDLNGKECDSYGQQYVNMTYTSSENRYSWRLPYYTSGVYNVCKPLYGGIYSASNDDSANMVNWKIILPTGGEIKNLIGTELTFVASPVSNCYLVSENTYHLVDMTQGTTQLGSQYPYNDNRPYNSDYSVHFKLPPGVTKVICVQDGAQSCMWVIEK